MNNKTPFVPKNARFVPPNFVRDIDTNAWTVILDYIVQETTKTL